MALQRSSFIFFSKSVGYVIYFVLILLDSYITCTDFIEGVGNEAFEGTKAITLICCGEG